MNFDYVRLKYEIRMPTKTLQDTCKDESCINKCKMCFKIKYKTFLLLFIRTEKKNPQKPD